jgi:hypothetical protein
MENILECCCGLFNHKESIIVCQLKDPLGAELKPQSDIRGFGTLLSDLVALRKWFVVHVSSCGDGKLWDLLTDDVRIPETALRTRCISFWPMTGT